jgi:hypothetical protein
MIRRLIVAKRKRRLFDYRRHRRLTGMTLLVREQEHARRAIDQEHGQLAAPMHRVLRLGQHLGKDGQCCMIHPFLLLRRPIAARAAPQHTK